jgi:hypothetical protein
MTGCTSDANRLFAWLHLACPVAEIELRTRPQAAKPPARLLERAQRMVPRRGRLQGRRRHRSPAPARAPSAIEVPRSLPAIDPRPAPRAPRHPGARALRDRAARRRSHRRRSHRRSLPSPPRDAAATKQVVKMRYFTASRGSDEWRHVSVHRVLAGPPVRFIGTCHRSSTLKWFRVDSTTRGEVPARRRQGARGLHLLRSRGLKPCV